ncbi:MAG TPA: hypothetical protein VFU47_06330, partial [Armatimonadota bacterium]|nr:hypothetical protein [Armatimonadota bacterium]
MEESQVRVGPGRGRSSCLLLAVSTGLLAVGLVAALSLLFRSSAPLQTRTARDGSEFDLLAV